MFPGPVTSMNFSLTVAPSNTVCRCVCVQMPPKDFRLLGYLVKEERDCEGVFEAVWRKSAHLEQDQWTRTALRSHNGRLIILRLLT